MSVYPYGACVRGLREGFQDFPGGSDGKESACNAGDLGSIPRFGRSPGEGTATHSSILVDSRGFYGRYSPWDCKELDMTEQLSLHFTSLPV